MRDSKIKDSTRSATHTAQDAIVELLSIIDHRRHFISTWLQLAERHDGPVTGDGLLALVNHITRVQELQPLLALAQLSLPAEEHRRVFLATAEHTIHRKLMLYNDALLCFLKQLTHAHRGGLISDDQYCELKLRAKKINIASAPIIQELLEVCTCFTLMLWACSRSRRHYKVSWPPCTSGQ